MSASAPIAATVLRHVLLAESRIRPHIYTTPVELCPFLSHEASGDAGAKVYLKYENEQKTGSFKIRGAFSKLIAVQERGARSFVTASTGNHAVACATAVNELNATSPGSKLSGLVCVPTSVNPLKKSKLEHIGANLLLHGRECLDAEMKALEIAKEQGLVYVSPYNDLDVCGGNGTVGVDLFLHQGLHDLDAVFVSVGGGGLIGGTAAFLKSVLPSIRVVGCSPAKSCVMVRSVQAGHIVDEEEDADTLSDGTAGGIDRDSFTFELCKQVVDEWITVSEEEIAASMFFMMEKHSKIVEGAAATAIAAFKRVAKRFDGKKVAIVLCGGNVSTATVSLVLGKYIKA